MNIQRRCANQQWPEDTLRNLKRLTELWTECRKRYAPEGDFLFGERSIADAFYIPIATRMRTYSIPLDETCQHYVDTVLNDADFLSWEKECVTGVWDQSGYSVIDGLYR